MKKSLIFMAMLLIFAVALTAVEVTLGTGTTSNGDINYPAPNGNYFKNTRTQYIYTANEFNDVGTGAGDITPTGLNVTALNGSAANPLWTSTTTETSVFMHDGIQELAADAVWNFYDSGGIDAGYQDNEFYTLTFAPVNGYRARVQFQTFSIEYTSDYFYVYDGPDTNAPLLGQFTGSTLPRPFTSTHTSGALTFRFDSDDFPSQDPGWYAIVSTVLAPVDPIFSAIPPERDFGIVNITGAGASQVFTIKNAGGGTLVLDSAISIGGANADQFSLIDTNTYPIYLTMNQTVTVTVNFNPTSLGEKQGTLIINDNIADDKSLTITCGTQNGAKIENSLPLTGIGFDGNIRIIPWLETVETRSQTLPLWTYQAGYNLWGVTTAIGGYGVSWQSFFLSLYNISDWTPRHLFTPTLDIDTEVAHNLAFDYAYATFETEVDKLEIFTSINDGTSYQLLETMYGGISGPLNTGGATHSWFVPNANQWRTKTIALPLGVNKIRFTVTSAMGNNLFLDNIRVLLPNTQIIEGTATYGDITLNIPEITDTYNNEPIAPSVVIESLINPTGRVAVLAGYGEEALPNAGLNLTFSGTNFAGTTITIYHHLGFMPDQIAYRITPGGWTILNSESSNILAWTNALVSFTPDARFDGEIVVVFPQNESDTLPVELSSFTAVLTADMFVNIAWVSESETNHSGYNLLRSETSDLDTAIYVNSALISNGTPNGSQMSYLFTDKEVDYNSVYYYWLEIVALNGNIEYAGPITATIGQPGTDPEVPEIQMATKLLNAYPNPFNPQTNIRYSIKDAGLVQFEIFNLKGQKIRSYSNNHATPGFYSQVWDGKDTESQVVGSGIYFYRMTSGNYSSTKKVMMLK